MCNVVNSVLDITSLKAQQLKTRSNYISVAFKVNMNTNRKIARKHTESLDNQVQRAWMFDHSRYWRKGERFPATKKKQRT